MKKVLLFLPLFFLAGCDSDPMVTIYQREITQTPITCMKLHVFPPNTTITKTLQEQYPFLDSCTLTLDVSWKSAIKCNSSYNAPQKALSTFPNSYLNMELRKGLTLQYSYYIDLTEKPDAAEVKKGFERIEKDLKLVR